MEAWWLNPYRVWGSGLKLALGFRVLVFPSDLGEKPEASDWELGSLGCLILLLPKPTSDVEETALHPLETL